MRRDPVLWVCGPSGVGKTSVGYALFDQLSRAGTATAFVDLDQLGLCYPAPADDPRHNRLKARNLGAAWSAFRAAGARCLVVSGLVDDAKEVRRHADALPGTDLTVCRLRGAPDELRDRIARRGSFLHLTEEAVRNAADLDRSTFADLVVDTTGRPAHAVAALLRESGWPDPLAQSEAPTPSPVGRSTGTPKVLLVCGPPAVGKSTVGYEIFRRVVGDGSTAAYVDLAQIGFCRPADQPDLRPERRAHLLSRLWDGFAAASARSLIISGAIADRAELSRYMDAIPAATWRVCRLRAEPDTLTGRVLLRGAGDGPAIAGDDLRGLPQAALRERATRAVRIAAALDRAAVGDLCLDTDGREVGDLADLVRSRLGGWPGP